MEKAELSLVLTDDEEIQFLNKTYRRKDRATDVLAFALREGEAGDVAGALLGDVIVSIPTARKQASARAREPIDEVTMLVAHGLLHLLGYDHRTDAEDRIMRRETDRLCAAAVPRRGARGRGGAASKAGRKRASVVTPARPGGPKAPTKTRARRQKITS